MDDDSRWRLLYTRKLEAEIVESFDLFRKAGVEPILIKGWAAARHYPAGVHRFYSDVDLAVSAADFEFARTMLLPGTRGRINVDVHREFRHLDTKSWKDVLNDSIEIDLDGAKIRVPSDEDHLRMMAVHWLNDGGARKDRLWDIYYAVQNRPSSFDWNQCLDSVSKIRQEWIITVISLAHKYLGLDIRELPFMHQDKQIPPWLVQSIEKEWKSGVPSRSLHTCLREPREFLRQLRKRIPPNPVQATIEMEGVFDNRSRLKYQLGTMIRRISPSIRGMRGTLRRQP